MADKQKRTAKAIKDAFRGSMVSGKAGVEAGKEEEKDQDKKPDMPVPKAAKQPKKKSIARQLLEIFK